MNSPAEEPTNPPLARASGTPGMAMSMGIGTGGRRNQATYPMPARLNFCPGGVACSTDASTIYKLDDYTPPPVPDVQMPVPGQQVSPVPRQRAEKTPDDIIAKAKAADDRLRQYALLYAKDTSVPHHLPSLSVLASAAFGRLTGAPSASAKRWADAMVVHYLPPPNAIDQPESIPASEDEIWNAKPPSRRSTYMMEETTADVLRRLLREAEDQSDANDVNSPSYRPRPCGYVFKRGDIAWNCRTCQTDSTCVICDSCFRNSNHDGHEVYFHRTTPGGCCDCGDSEAWRSDGCCDAHRPTAEVHMETNSADDPEEAVRMAHRGRQEGVETLKNQPTALPQKFAAALGVVIGAAVNCLLDAVDGAGVGSDPIQWKLRWSDEAAKLWNTAVRNDEYHGQRTAATPGSFLDSAVPQPLPSKYALELRLHNDDVHTFDEVIEALHEPRHARRNVADPQNNPSLVVAREAAHEMTHHVDSDGQVTVKHYNNISGALHGFRRLTSRGLHCAVVSTAQSDAEIRAKALSSWLTEISAAHPAAAVLVVHALVQSNSQHGLGGVSVWREPRMIPPWMGGAQQMDEVKACRVRFQAFPPHWASSYLTSEEAEKLHIAGLRLDPSRFMAITGTNPGFYADVPYRLPPTRYHKSPHALWGTLPSLYTDPQPFTEKHPLMHILASGQPTLGEVDTGCNLTETVYVVDTDLRKQQEADRITSSMYPHKLPGLHIVSGIGTVRAKDLSQAHPPLPNSMEWRHLLDTSSFRAPMTPIILLLLLDPYPTKQLRGAIHALFLSLLTDARFKCRFAAALGIAYRPLSTLFCAGVGTEGDTPLGFTVQIFTAGSLVRALGSAPAVEKLLVPDDESENVYREASIGVFTMPIAHIVVRCIHTNLLGATKEVHMILNNTATGNDADSQDDTTQNENLLPALTYVAGEHPLMVPLPAAPDDGFLDSRSTRHKRLPHLLRDLEYVIETPGTAMKLLLPRRYPSYQGISLSSRGEEILNFATIWSRLLRLAQGMDPQKRKISGGHVEYEQNRWLEAFGLSLNFAGTRDALAESPTNSSSASLAPVSEDGSHLVFIREAIGNVISALLREMKLWLYREGMLETGLPIPSTGSHVGMDLSQVDQRSTLHVSASQLAASPDTSASMSGNVNAIALACATSIKMTEAQLDLIESALRVEGNQRQFRASLSEGTGTYHPSPTSGAVMGDWLRVPHSPLAGDSLSFHLPLHRAIAKSIRSLCAVVVPEMFRNSNPRQWWKLPVLDEGLPVDATASASHHPLVPLIRPILRSSNCRVVWSAGPDCSPQEAQRRRSRSKTVSANIAVAKIIHSLADHPIRCLSAAQQIERHLWARNGSSTAGMALNYSSTPLCRSFRDLDLTLVQLSAAGMSVGLGARRVFALLVSRFNMDGYLCDPERRTQNGPGSGSTYGNGPGGGWVNPPRFLDPDHAVVLSESFFCTLCVIVTELPPPPPVSPSDETWLRQSVRRELVHALVAEPRSHSAAMAAASCAISRRDESDGSAGTSGGGGLFRDVFADVLREVGKQKSQGMSRAVSGPPAYELKPDCCDEYDPTFFHLRRQEHQHAMDVVAHLRRQKLSKGRREARGTDTHCLPLVCAPPKAHPRFLPCRLLLHLASMDAAIRRSLLFALTGGSWLPPAEPIPKDVTQNPASDSGITSASASESTTSESGDAPVIGFTRRALSTGGSPSNPFQRRGSFSDNDILSAFSSEVVASSSVSFLEVLQLLTLQVHTLEECASLHRTQPDLDDEAKSLSAGLSINSYLGRLVRVPDSLIDVWALRTTPHGPLSSKGSGEKRGSILGLLIALYEHRSDHGRSAESAGGQDKTGDEHGGARALASSGLKWLLRFVNALVDGAPSVGAAAKSATTGVPIRQATNLYTISGEPSTSIWTIDENVRVTIKGMLADLPELWPTPKEHSPEKAPKSDRKSKARGKAAQKRMMEMMRKKQHAFKATIAPSENGPDTKDSEDGEADLCIICRCDDSEEDTNGPLGYLGHVQRTRISQLRACAETGSREDSSKSDSLYQTYRVIGHMGCQLRETEAMDSKPLACLRRGSIVTVAIRHVSPKYDILSRRVFVRHVDESTDVVTEGWASIQSAQGYVILSPIVSLCYENTRWGNTRPMIRQCGHAAHFKCVETHTVSLHQRAAGDQPYDGRFAANIDDGEFLCPLCKQLSNILIPRDGCARRRDASKDPGSIGSSTETQHPNKSLRDKLTQGSVLTQHDINSMDPIGQKALADFGSHLMGAMDVPWERTSGNRKRKNRKWHPAIQKWDYEEEAGHNTLSGSPSISSILRLLRQQHIAWAAVGHSAAISEASNRGVEEVLSFGTFSKIDDPWPEYSKTSNSHPALSELKRTLAGAAGLNDVLSVELRKQLAGNLTPREDAASIVGVSLANILEGESWVLSVADALKRTISDGARENLVQWSQLAALMASMPCHVARDGMLSQRHEARAAAASMWVVRGVGAQLKHPSEPPVPLAVERVRATTSPKPSKIPLNWGTMSPFTSPDADIMSESPFRPAIATSFLYMPLLAWDLNTLAGAIFSTVLLNDAYGLPCGSDLLHAAHVLLVGRAIQAMISPYGFEHPDSLDVDGEDEDEGRWTLAERESENQAVSKLTYHCRKFVKSKLLDPNVNILSADESESSAGLFGRISRAILPFARSLILMLRACSSVIKDRKRLIQGSQEHESDAALGALLVKKEIMSSSDGFFILKEMKGPSPNDLVSSSDWLRRVNRWLVGVVGLERHHGSRGFSLVPQITNASLSVTEEKPVESVDTSQDIDMSTSDGTGASGLAQLNARATNTSPHAVSLAQFPLESGVEQPQVNMDVERNHRHIQPGVLQFFLDNEPEGDPEDPEDSDDDLVEDMQMDEAEEIVGFVGQVIRAASLGAVRTDGGPTAGDESADEPSNSGSDIEAEIADSSHVFANISQSPIISYQPSFLALEKVGPGRRESSFEYLSAGKVMSDLSHLGMIHRKDSPTFSLIRLPKSFVELYGIVNRVKGRDEGATLDEVEDVGNSETAICLLTGTVMRSGSTKRSVSRAQRPPGACTVHARATGSGIGIFFLVQKCTVLLMHNNKSAYSPSIFVDEHGEEDPGLRRGRPLFLNEARYRALELLWRQQGVPREVAQIRSTSDRVIRDNWY